MNSFKIIALAYGPTALFILHTFVSNSYEGDIEWMGIDPFGLILVGIMGYIGGITRKRLKKG